MKALTFLIRLIEPVLATQAQSGEPNSATAYSFIPGSMLRGAIIARYLKGGQMNAGDENNIARKLFFNGTVRYLNAYPARAGDDSRLLPRPSSWLVPKDEVDDVTATIYDDAVKKINLDKSLKPPKGDFCWRDEYGAQLGTPTMQITVHNASSNRSCKSEGESQVYRYDAIAARQVFSGVIISDDQTLLTEQIQPLLDAGKLVLGGSHTGGYGRVEITDVNLDTDWLEYNSDTVNELGSDQVILTCLSDVIWRSKNGQVDGDFSELVGEKPSKIFRRMRLVGGFNRKWGLPLQQAWAIEAGSVFVFSGTHKATLEGFIEDGIGERRAEGFGRIAVNWHTRHKLLQNKLPKRELPAFDLVKLSRESEELAQRMADRRYLAELERVLARRISEFVGENTFQGLPRPAQISRARLVALQAWQSGKLEVIKRHFDNSFKSKFTRLEWEGAKVGQRSLVDWILEQAKNKDAFNLITEIPTVAGVPANVAKWRDKTIARFIEGVLKQAVKVAKKKAVGGQS